MNLKPFISQCCAVSDERNPIETRCKNKPDPGNYYFCKDHYNELHTKKIASIRARGIPNVVGSNQLVCYVLKNKSKKSKIKKVLDIVSNKNKEKNTATQKRQKQDKIYDSSASKIIDEVSKKITNSPNKKVAAPKKVKNYINIKKFKKAVKDKIEEFKDLKNKELMTVAKAIGVKGKFKNRLDLIKAMVKQEARGDKT